jgi:hypothetical protein
MHLNTARGAGLSGGGSLEAAKTIIDYKPEAAKRDDVFDEVTQQWEFKSRDQATTEQRGGSREPVPVRRRNQHAPGSISMGGPGDLSRARSEVIFDSLCRALSPMASPICRPSAVYALITKRLLTSPYGLMYILNENYVFRKLMNSKARANLVR